MTTHNETIEVQKGYTVQSGDLQTTFEKRHSWFTRGFSCVACFLAALVLFHAVNDDRLHLTPFESFAAFAAAIAFVCAGIDICEGIKLIVTFKIKEVK